MAGLPQTTSNPLAAVEVLLPYGGDYSLTSTGDLQLVKDQPGNPAATTQRIIFLLLTNPGDDLFNLDYGAGCRATVGRPNVMANVDAIRRTISSALANDPFVAVSPGPTIGITLSPDNQSAIIAISFFSVIGQYVSLPDISLSPNSIQIGAAA